MQIKKPKRNKIVITPEVLRACVGAIIVEEDGNVIADDEEKIISELENASRRKIFELNIKGGFRLHVDLVKKECKINHAVTVRDFQYLHQLQNLVFVLSGKELEINETVMQ